MKTTTIGRIGAIIAGAAMLGTAVASALAGAVEVPSDLTKGFFISASGSPAVQVVVGEKAQASDGAAAGQIAAIIGNMAFTTTTSQQSGGTVEVQGGTTTCNPGSVACNAGNAEGQVKLSWAAIGMVGDLEQKEMNCDVYDGGMNMTDLTEGGDDGDWADSDDVDFPGIEIYTPETTVGTTLVGACQTGAGADVAVLKSGEFPNEICTICYNYCDIALGCEPHMMSEWVQIDANLIEIEYDCDEEALVVSADDDSVKYNVFTDDILTADIQDADGALVGQSYLGQIIIGQNEYYVEDTSDDKITIVCGGKGVATTSAAMEYVPPAEGSACDAADSGDTYSMKLVGAQTIEEKGVVDVTLEVTKPDGTTEQVTSGISGTPVVGDIKVKLQRGTAASNVITGEQSFSANLLVWYVPSENTFEDDETYDEKGVNIDEYDDDVNVQWELDFNGGEALTVADVEALEDDELLGDDGATDLDDLDITENMQWEDCYEDADNDVYNGSDTPIIRWLEFSLQELEDGLPAGELIQLPFNDGKYLLSKLKFGYEGLYDENFKDWSMQDTTEISVEVQEIEVYNQTTDDFLEYRTAVVMNYVDEDGDSQEVRIDEGPFGTGDVVLIGNDIFKIEDIDFEDGSDLWNVTYEKWVEGDFEDDDGDDFWVSLAATAVVNLTVNSQIEDVIVSANYVADGVGHFSEGAVYPIAGAEWYMDNTTDDEGDEQLYIDADTDAVGGAFIDLVSETAANIKTELDVVDIQLSDAASSVTIRGDTQSGAEDWVIINLDDNGVANLGGSFVNLTCDEETCEDIQTGDTDGTLVSLSGARVVITGDSDVDEPDEDSTNADDVLTEVTVTVPENELRPTLFFGTETTQNSTSVTITKAQEGTVVDIGGVDVTVDSFGVSVAGGGVIVGNQTTVQCPTVTGTCPAVSVPTQAPAGIGYNLVVLDSAADSSKNLVLIGGPAVNSLTQGLLAASEVCPDASAIKLSGTKLVVAGCEAKDTMAAAQALAAWLKALPAA